ncbi:hypothetical protein [Nocardia sp. NPDC059239]
MVSWREELTRREAAAAGQAEQLRGQIAELTEQLVVAEQLCRGWRSRGKR